MDTLWKSFSITNKYQLNISTTSWMFECILKYQGDKFWCGQDCPVMESQMFYLPDAEKNLTGWKKKGCILYKDRQMKIMGEGRISGRRKGRKWWMSGRHIRCATSSVFCSCWCIRTSKVRIRKHVLSGTSSGYRRMNEIWIVWHHHLLCAWK